MDLPLGGPRRLVDAGLGARGRVSVRRAPRHSGYRRRVRHAQRDDPPPHRADVVHPLQDRMGAYRARRRHRVLHRLHPCLLRANHHRRGVPGRRTAVGAVLEGPEPRR